MSLKAIIEQIQAVGTAQVQAIRSQGEQEVQDVLSEAQSEARQIYQTAFQEALAPETGEIARIRNRARFEASCITGSARERVVDTVLQTVSQHMTTIRCDPRYALALKGILLELLPGENGLQPRSDMLVLEADPRDRELLEQIMLENALDIPVEYVLTCWGGLNARSPDRKIRLINTLEARLERALPYLKQRLAVGFEQVLQGAQKSRPPVKAKPV